MEKKSHNVDYADLLFDLQNSPEVGKWLTKSVQTVRMETGGSKKTCAQVRSLSYGLKKCDKSKE